MPKLVNRGGAGLLSKPKAPAAAQKLPLPEVKAVKDRIAAGLKHLVVPLAGLKHDPVNARLHPDRNMEAIKNSLCQYGQVKPVVVRKQTNVVMAGNGTLRAARELGWTKIAAVFVAMTDVEAAGYGIADNRTAELAAWDFEVVARLDKLIQEAGHVNVGWSSEELAALRANDYEAPQEFPEVDENIEVEHVCPKCGYQFSGGEVAEKGIE